jgi:uncharacterized membrane protein
MLELRVHNQYYDPNYGYGYGGGGGGLSVGGMIIIFVAVFVIVLAGIYFYRRWRSGQMGGGDPNYSGPNPGYQQYPPAYQ